MSEIAVMGDSETVLGLKLAGITRCVSCEGGAEADAKIKGLLEDEGVGLVILSQSLLPHFSRKTRKAVGDSVKPVVITIPERTAKESAGVTKLSIMIKRAIGVDLMNK